MSREIQIGELLDNRFEITAFIERSGMAMIFKALDLETRRKVVIKLPHTEFEANPGSAARFAREAALISTLDHPGIAKIIAVAEKSRPYVAMEFIEGETLYDILERAGPLPEGEAIRSVSPLCDIVEHMHRYDVIHCDLKPGNIMISDDGTVHIIDFGVARKPARSSPKIGTPGYMAPEQIQGGPIDARTDVYGLGVVLYEAVTGTRPLHGSAGATRPPRELNSDLSEQIEEIILHAMAPRPSDRYSSAASMKAELDSPEAVQVTGRYRNPRKANAWPKRLWLAGVILGIGAVPFVLFYFFLLMFQRQLAR